MDKILFQLGEAIRRLIAPVLPSPGSGASGCLWACEGLALFIYWEGKGHSSLPRSPPHAASMLCSW